MAASKPRIRLPEQAQTGDIIEIKALITHVMETGNRKDAEGNPIPRNIIKEFVCTYNGTEIFRAELFSAISANPYLSFTTIATENGTITMTWLGDNGFSATESVAISVE